MYIAPLQEKLLRGTPDPTKPNHNQKGWYSDGCGREAETEQEFRTEAARQSIPKRWTNNGKASALGHSQPNPTLCMTRSPCSAERRDLRPGKDDTGTQSSLR